MAVPPPPPPPPDAHHPADAHHLADAGHVWRWPASGGIVVSAPAALSRRAIFGRVKSRRGRGALDANRLMTSATSSRSAAPLSRAAERRGVAWRGRLSPAAAPATCSDRSPSLVTRACNMYRSMYRSACRSTMPADSAPGLVLGSPLATAMSRGPAGVGARRVHERSSARAVNSWEPTAEAEVGGPGRWCPASQPTEKDEADEASGVVTFGHGCSRFARKKLGTQCHQSPDRRHPGRHHQWAPGPVSDRPHGYVLRRR